MVAPEKYALAKTDDFTAFQNFENWLMSADFTYYTAEPKVVNIKEKTKIVYSVYIEYSDNESFTALKKIANNKTGFFCCTKVSLERKYIVCLTTAEQQPDGFIKMEIIPDYVYGLLDTLEEAEVIYEQKCTEHNETMPLTLLETTADVTNGDDDENIVIIERKAHKIHICDEVKNSGKPPFKVADEIFMPFDRFDFK